MAHAAIVRLAIGRVEARVESVGWWAQGVAVAYEQTIGRRQAGQRSDGTFEVAVSRTAHLNRDDAYQNLVALIEACIQEHSIAASNQRSSSTPKRSYWKCDVANGGSIILSVETKHAGVSDTSLCVITHAKLGLAEDAARWKTVWSTLLADFA